MNESVTLEQMSRRWRESDRKTHIAIANFLDELNKDLPNDGPEFTILRIGDELAWPVVTFQCYVPDFGVEKFFQVSMNEIECSDLTLARHFRRRIVMEICREVLLGEKFL